VNLHRLTLRAIGPYSGEHAVDLAALGASGLFLLEGPTGSGKSTIIDAVVFALYGGLAGSTSTADRLRSHHADPAVEPFVELVFETAAGVHRIRRSPQYRRPKARGTGTTAQNATAKLVRLGSPDAAEGEVLATTTQEAGAEVARIVGLTRQQFVQTIVLPQGEFAAFLRSTGEQRREVLQSLFGTELYERTTAQLVEGRVAARAAIAEAERAVERARERLREATGTDEAAFAEALAADGCRGLVASLLTESEVSATARSEATAVRDAARTALDEQRRLRAALDRLADLRRRAERLEADRADVDRDRAGVDAARRARSVTGAALGVDRAEAQLSSARGWLVRARDGVAAVVAAAPAADRDAVSAYHDDLDRAGAADLRDALAGEIGGLVDVEGTEKGLAGRRRAVADLDERAASLRTRAARAEVALEGRSEGRVALVAAVAALGETGAGVRAAEAAVGELDEALRRLDDVDARRTALLVVEARAAEATRAALDAVDAEADLRRRSVEGRAGDLAAGLLPGEPCPVCGATEHPAPAVTVDDHPDEAALDDAAEHRATAVQAQAEALARVEADRAVLDEAVRASGGFDREVVVASRAEAAAAVEAARAAVEERHRLDRELAAHDAETDRLRAERDAATVEAATTDERLAAARQGLAADEELVTARRGRRAGSVHELVELLGERRRALDDLVAALDREAVALGQVDQRRGELATALDEAGFADVAAAEQAALEQAALLAAEARVAAAERETAVVAAGLADPELVALDDPELAEGVDVDAATAASVAAEQALAGATERAASSRTRADRSSAALEALRAAEGEGDEVVARARAVVRMADLASASTSVNVKGVTLGTYVLLRRFDDVVAAANLRLSTMSGGRYELRPSEEREARSRGRKTGLSLVIHDHVTGTTRDPGSFSGGETFYASLSLALGLADVVQREAGGLELGTLFVDEGFGSLDPETLDAVMTELGRLSASGRVIGIVSHVDELKQRIADRLEVRRRPDGSSTLRSTVG